MLFFWFHIDHHVKPFGQTHNDRLFPNLSIDNQSDEHIEIYEIEQDRPFYNCAA